MWAIERLKGFVYNPAKDHVQPGDTDDDDTESYDNLVRRALAKAHENPVVCAGINWITDQASTSPLTLSELNADGDFQPVATHPLLDLLNEPNEALSGTELFSVSIWDMFTAGQCFWKPESRRNGQVAELTFLPAVCMEVRGNAENLVTGYRYRPGGNRAPIDYTPEEIVHIRIKPDPRDPKNGMSPLACVAASIVNDKKSEEYTANQLSAEGAAGGFLMPPATEGVMDPETAKATRSYIKSEFSGTRSGALGVLGAFMEYVETGLSPRDLTLRTLQNTSEQRICGALGVHPAILGFDSGIELIRAGAAMRELGREAWGNRIITLQNTFAQQIGRQLLPLFEDDPERWAVGWDRENVILLQPDLKDEAERWSISMRAGAATRYDARRAQGLEADEETDNVYVLPFSANISDGSVTETPEASAPPDVAVETRGHSHDYDDRSLIEQAILITAQTKAQLDMTQRSLLMSLADDAQRLEREFTDELVRAFRNLGERAVEAFWQTDDGNGVGLRAADDVKLKQEDEDLDEAPDHERARRIMAAISIQQWTDEVWQPAWDGHVLRTLNATVDTVNTAIGLGVDIPDSVAREIVRVGGTRRGLVDVPAQTREAIFRALHEGRSLGEGPVDLAARIRDEVPAGRFVNAGPRYRAELLSRTETKNAQNLSTLETYKAADTITAVLIIDAELGPTDPVCESVDGRTVTFQEAEAIGALAHPNCTRSFVPIVRS